MNKVKIFLLLSTLSFAGCTYVKTNVDNGALFHFHDDLNGEDVQVFNDRVIINEGKSGQLVLFTTPPDSIKTTCNKYHLRSNGYSNHITAEQVNNALI